MSLGRGETVGFPELLQESHVYVWGWEHCQLLNGRWWAWIFSILSDGRGFGIPPVRFLSPSLCLMSGGIDNDGWRIPPSPCVSRLSTFSIINFFLSPTVSLLYFWRIGKSGLRANLHIPLLKLLFANYCTVCSDDS